MSRPVRIIGELMNNSFARARKAWEARDLAGYRNLAKIQTDLGADFMTLYLGGTQTLAVKLEEMKSFLPDLVPALQAETAVPISFDNPSVEYHREALKHYDRARSPAPIVNSLAASRERLDEFLELIRAYDTRAIIMASERMLPGGGSAKCGTPAEIHQATRQLVELLRAKAGRTNDQIIVDPGLAPVAADVEGLTNLGLDAIRLIRADPDLAGIHLSVGLTNFSFGMPPKWRIAIENAYLTEAVAAGLDFVLGNPEKPLALLPADDPTLVIVREALRLGRPVAGEPADEAGMRQTEKIMELCR